ncbi:MAG: hypothetical protein QG562_728, partial [Patescibacteria group bacterium]|nr:hypothetical protein [Patescibacteria group bacterium]
MMIIDNITDIANWLTATGTMCKAFFSGPK